MQAAWYSDRKQCLDLAGEEQIALCGPILNIIEGMSAGERAPVDQSAAVGNPVQHRWIVVVLHCVTGIGEGNEPHPGLNCTGELTSMTTQKITHCGKCLLNNFLGHLFAGEPSCKCGHLNFLLVLLIEHRRGVILRAPANP